jgi:hypothetical protein
MIGATPGPWGVERTSERLWIGPMRPDGAKVAVVVCGLDHSKDYLPAYNERQEANANLLAAAWEMREALDGMVKCFDPAALARPPASEFVRKRLEVARAALAKADPLSMTDRRGT